MMVAHKTLLGALSVAITVAAYLIYIWQTAKKEGVQPHPFSWFLWGLLTAVAYFVQRSLGAGPGSWVTGLAAAMCIFIGVLTFLRYTWRFAWFDWFSLGTGLLVFGFYLLARDPAQSVLLATITDVIGYGPTIKKGWVEPRKDSATCFALHSVKFIPSLLALESYSLATWLYPIALFAANGSVAVLLVVRRRYTGGDYIRRLAGP